MNSTTKISRCYYSFAIVLIHMDGFQNIFVFVSTANYRNFSNVSEAMIMEIARNALTLFLFLL